MRMMLIKRKANDLMNHANQWIKLERPIIFIVSFRRFSFS